MASDTSNVKVGVCKVFFDDVDLGYTKGGVEVTVKTDTYKVNVDQFGKTTINESLIGREVMAKVPLAETTLENLVAIMPGAVLVPSGGGATNPVVTVPTAIGTELLSGAKELRLHPKSLPDNDKSEDFVIPLANTAGALTFAYKLEDERIYNVEFTGYPNPTTGLLFQVGDN
jgi:hypothetical protein